MGKTRLASKLPAISKKADLYTRETAKLILNYRGQRQSTLRKWKFDMLRFITPIAAVEECNGIRYYVGTSEWLGRCLYGDGFYEQCQMARAIDVIQSMRGGPPPLKGRRFIDIGANIGTATITAVKVFGANGSGSLSFEPDPNNFKLLQCNLIMNDLGSRVRTFQTALSNSSGTAILELCQTDSGDHRVRTAVPGDEGMFQETERPTIRVPLARFDDLLDINMEDVGLVWMDTQGHEGHVLEGATAVLHSDVPVVLEYWPYGLRRARGLELLHSLIAQHYSTVVDLSVPKTSAVYRAEDIDQLVAQYPKAQFTDLLLLK